MLAIFDIDGTICDTQSAEDLCYSTAIQEVTGIQLDSFDWSIFREPTSSGIVQQLLEDHRDAKAKEHRIKSRFVELLREAKPNYPQDFSPIEGAIEFIHYLRAERVCDVAIATGGFDTEAHFKLRCCGLDLESFPHATSSDTPERRQIIPLAAERAGVSLASCVYFGDAAWDIKVSSELCIPLIGIGRKKEIFKNAGKKNHFRDFSQQKRIIEVLNSYRKDIQQDATGQRR